MATPAEPPGTELAQLHSGRSASIIDDHLADNPSLESSMDEAMARAYRVARLDAAGETGLPDKTFPAKCPWAYAEIMKS